MRYDRISLTGSNNKVCLGAGAIEPRSTNGAICIIGDINIARVHRKIIRKLGGGFNKAIIHICAIQVGATNR